jgi:hypothetical protein
MSIVDKSDEPYSIKSPRNRHRITIDGAAVSVRSCKTDTPLKSVGQCRDGCCDDYRCPECGESFRVEWPD